MLFPKLVGYKHKKSIMKGGVASQHRSISTLKGKFPSFLGPLLWMMFLWLFSMNASAQELITKDGEKLGTREEFIESCARSMEAEDVRWKEGGFDAEHYCACMCDSLIPKFEKEELEEAAVNDSYDELLFQDEENFQTLMNCFQKMGSGEETREPASAGPGVVPDSSTKGNSVMVSTCVEEVMSDPSNNGVWSREAAQDYCQCAMDEFKVRGYGLDEIEKADQPGSKAFNEVVLPCVQKVREQLGQGSTEDEELSNDYVPEDLSGEKDTCWVPLKERMDRTYRLEMQFGGLSKDLIFDTGASELLIDRQTERELLAEGLIDPQEDLGVRSFYMANNERVDGRMVRIEKLRIGDFEVRNVIAAVLDEGELLCGVGFFDKFRDWEWDRKRDVLILQK